MKTKLIIIATVVIFMATVVLLYYLHLDSEKEVIKRFKSEQQLDSRRLAKEIEHYLNNRSQEINSFLSYPSLQNRDEKKITTDINTFWDFEKNNHVKDVNVYDEKGTVICSTTKEAIGQNYAEYDFFQWALKKENKGNQFVSSLIKKTNNKNQPLPYFYCLLVVPIYKSGKNASHLITGNKLVGLVGITIDLEEKVSELLPLLNAYANKEHAYILDSSGTVILQTEHRGMVLQNVYRQNESCKKCHNSFDYVKTILSKREGTIEYSFVEKPKELASFSSMEFKNLSWKIVVCIPYAEISGFINRNLYTTLILITIVTLTLIGGFSLIYHSNRLKIRAQEEAKQWMEKRKLEDKIRESEEHYRKVVDISPDAILIHCEGKIVFVNPAAVKLVGASNQKDLLGKPAIEFVHPDERESIGKRILEILKSGNPSQWLEERFIRMDGSPIYVETIGTPTTYNSKSAVQVIVHDITERKRVAEELYRRNEELSVIYTVDQAVNQTLSLNQILNFAIDKTIEVLHADSGGIYLLQEDSKTMKFVVHRGLSDEFVKNVETIQLGEGISGRAAAEKKPVIMNIPDYPSKRLAPFIINEGLQSIVSVPLLAKDRVLGVINVGSRNQDSFPADKVEILLSIGIQIGVAIQNAELFETEQKRTKQLSAINKISQSIAGLMNVDKLFSLVVNLIYEIFGYSYITFAVVDENANEIIYKAAAGYNIAELKGYRQKLGGAGIIPWVASSNQPLLTNDVSTEPRFQNRDVQNKTCSELAVPIVVQNKVAAVLDVESDKLNAFTSDDLSAFESIAYDIGVALENIQLYEDLRGTTNYLENLITYANAPIIVWNLEHKITIFNHAFEKLSGYRSDEVIGCDLEILFPLMDKDKILKQIEQTIKGEQWETVEIPIQRKDFKQRIALWNSASIIDKDGNICATIAQGQDITERKLAEEELRAAEKRFRALIEKSSDVVSLLDSNGTIIYESPAAMHILGYSLNELKGRNAFELVHPEDMKKTKELFSQLIRRPGDSVNVQFRFRHNDGSWRYLDAIGTNMLFDPDIQAVIVNYRDVTDRMKAEQKITMLANSLKSINECVSITEIDNKIIFVNRSFLETYGFSEDELLGKHISIVGSSNNPPELVEEILPATLQGGWRGELWNKRKDGSKFLIYLSTTIINDKDGNPLGLIGVAKDISERKRTEEELISQKNKFQQLFENSPIAIVLLDDQYKIIQFNESFSALFGYYLEEIKGQALDDIIVPPELKKEAKSYSDQTRIGNQINKESYRRKKDGSNIFVQVIGVPVSVNDTTVGIYGMYVDLTQRKDAEEKMKLAKELAEQSDKLKSEFLAQMSHEIRTPINIILGNIDYLKDSFDEKTDSDARDCFDGIDLASKRIIRTIDLILNVAELQVGSYIPKFKKVDLNSEILTKLYHEELILARQKGLEFIYQCNVPEPVISIDIYSMTQIFANLIDNAIKYTKQGKVEILLNQSRNQICVEVKDTGVGMSKEFLPKMFEPFVQEDQGYSRGYEGNGLGLTLAKKYCDINNAIIEVESEKNVGSTFRIIFAEK